jgi:biopolymer transport protein ExbB/TolQ
MMLLLNLATAMAADEAAPGFTMAEIWEHSGMVARGVIVTLVFLLLVTLFVAFERFLAFGKATTQSKELAARIIKPLQAQDVAGALKLARDEEFKAGYFGALVRSGLAELDARRDHHGLENAHRAVSKTVIQEIAKMRRGMPVLATVGSTAPFVGLFGTTVGVINAFQGMASSGAGLAGISAGISEALITTAVGIFVAVVGVWFFNYYNTRIDKVTEELSSIEADFMDWATKLLQPAAPAPAAAPTSDAPASDEAAK